MSKARLQSALCMSTVVLLIFLLYIPVLFDGRTFFAFDTIYSSIPWSPYAGALRPNNPLITDPVNENYLMHDYIHRERGADGNPHWWRSLFCGMPLDPYLFPPLAIFFGLFPPMEAHDAYLAFFLLITGWSTYRYLRSMALRRLPALIGGIAWMLNGYCMVWFEFENVSVVAATLPFTLWMFERWRLRRTPRNLILLALGLSSVLCTGSVQLAIYESLFLAAYIPWSLARGAPGLRALLDRWMKALPAMAIAGICAGILFSGVFVVGLAKYSSGNRKAFSFSELYNQTGKLPAQYLITMVYPDFFGSPLSNSGVSTPRTAPTQAYNNYNELCIYAGIVPFVLALMGVSLRRNSASLFYFIAALASLSMAAGCIAYYPLARFIPGLALSTPTRIVFVFGFCVAILSAEGAQRLFYGVTNRRRTLALAILVVVPALAAVLLVQTEVGRGLLGIAVQPSGIADRLVRDHFSVLSPVILQQMLLLAGAVAAVLYGVFTGRRDAIRFSLVALVVLESVDLLSFARSYNTTSKKTMAFPSTPGIRFLQADSTHFRIVTFGPFLHNGFAAFGIEDIGGYMSFYPQEYGEYLHLSQYGLAVPFPERFSRWITFVNFDSPMLDLLGTKYLLVPRDVGNVCPPGFRLVYEGEMKILANDEALPRAFYVPFFVRCRTRNETYMNLSQFTVDDFRTRVILEDSLPTGWSADSAVPADSCEAVVTVNAYTADRIDLTLDAPRNGFVVISNSFHPSWQASTDGKPVPVLKANHVMQAIPVSAGKHLVELRFHPKPVIRGAMVSYIGWTILLVSGLACSVPIPTRPTRKTKAPTRRKP